MKQFFSVGDIIYGYCNGYFGRDDYDIKTCVMVNDNYAVFQNDRGYGTVLNKCENIDLELVKSWKTPYDYDNQGSEISDNPYEYQKVLIDNFNSKKSNKTGNGKLIEVEL